MYDNLSEAREQVLLDLYEQLETLPFGSDEFLRASQAIANLEKSLSERYKADSEYEAKMKQSENDVSCKEKIADMESEYEAKKNRTDTIMKGVEIGTKVVMLGAQLFVFSDQLSKSRAFEQTGIEACSSFKKLWSGFKPFNISS